jgi:hypothetical protein
MALKQTIKFSGPAYIQDSSGAVLIGNQTADVDFYIKVEQVDSSKEAAIAVVRYTSAHNAVLSKTFKFTPSVADGSKNFIAQAYEHLNSLPEFAGAQDC